MAHLLSCDPQFDSGRLWLKPLSPPSRRRAVGSQQTARLVEHAACSGNVVSIHQLPLSIIVHIAAQHRPVFVLSQSVISITVDVEVRTLIISESDVLAEETSHFSGSQKTLCILCDSSTDSGQVGYEPDELWRCSASILGHAGLIENHQCCGVIPVHVKVRGQVLSS